MKYTDGLRPQLIENLENRILFSTFNVADFGAAPDDGRDDRAAVQAAIDAGRNGGEPADAVLFPKGTYEIRGTLRLPGGVSLSGKNKANLTFTTGRSEFAIELEPNASGITIDGLNVRANNGVIHAGAFVRDVHVTNNDFVWGFDGSYYSRLAVQSTGGSDGLVIEHNHFHDSLASDRNIDVYGGRNFSYSYNTFFRVRDGGHMVNMTENVKFNYNRGEQINRMMIEWQDHSSLQGKVGKFEAIGNVAFNWHRPWRDTGWMSIPLQYSGTPDKPVVVKDNYLRMDSTGHYSSDGRAGFAYELAFLHGIAENNVAVSSGKVHDLGGTRKYVAGLVSASHQLPIKNNKLFGDFTWGAKFGEPRNVVPGTPGGAGTWNDLGGNVHTRDTRRAPQPPSAESMGAGVRRSPDSSTDDDGATNGDQQQGDHTSSGGGGDDQGGKDFTPVNDSGTTYLSDLQWRSASSGWGDVEINTSNGERGDDDGRGMRINGIGHRKGLGVAVESEVVYELDGEYAKFSAEVGIDDEVGDDGSMTFEVWADGERVYESPVLTGADGAEVVEVDVSGVRELKLVTTDGGDGANSDHGNWAGARVE